MHRRGARLERLVRSRHRDAALADGLDLVGPRIDERHIVARTRQERSEVASDGSGADEGQLLAHVPPPVACMLRRPGAGSTAEFRAKGTFRLTSWFQRESRAAASAPAGEEGVRNGLGMEAISRHRHLDERRSAASDAFARNYGWKTGPFEQEGGATRG